MKNANDFFPIDPDECPDCHAKTEFLFSVIEKILDNLVNHTEKGPMHQTNVLTVDTEGKRLAVNSTNFITDDYLLIVIENCEKLFHVLRKVNRRILAARLQSYGFVFNMNLNDTGPVEKRETIIHLFQKDRQ